MLPTKACPHCGTTAHQRREDGRCVACGKPLPEDLKATPENVFRLVEPQKPKRSIFRDFITAIRKAWRKQLPAIRPIKESMTGDNGPDLPKSSTFYAGVSAKSGLHVFIHFQPSPKPWDVGKFTINLILSKQEGAPEAWTNPNPDPPINKREIARLIKLQEQFRAEGSYRLGNIVGKNDKWWCLTSGSLNCSGDNWRPTSYHQTETVLVEAVAAVTSDILAACKKLGVVLGPTHQDSK